MTQEQIVFRFPVLWEGWACDSTGWIIEREDGSRYLRLTNHGSPYEANPEELLERIAEYEKVINLTRKALDILNSK